MPPTPLKILLIEDSPTDALLLRQLLLQVSEFPFEMEHVIDLETALKNISINTYDAIISDLGLPDSFGMHHSRRSLSYLVLTTEIY